MSNTLKLACTMPRPPKFRLYVAEEEGAKLVRHGSFASLKKALRHLAEIASVIDYQVRIYWNGTEKLIHADGRKL